MRVSFRRKELKKLYPLAISRGTMASSENLFVLVEDGEHSGIGELSPATGKDWSAERGESQLREFVEAGALDDAPAPYETYERMRRAQLDPPAMAALDTALWDQLAKRARMPLYTLLGLPRRAVPTSITIGLNEPRVTRERVEEMLARTGCKFLKVKLGSAEGREFDKAHFEAAREAAAPFGVGLRVDANGGWNPEEAVSMIEWLGERTVEYVEQPLAEGSEQDLPYVYERRRLPIFIDESCRFSEDVPKWAHCVDGINLKLMKCGGITEALRIVAAARAHGLQTMIGCMSESSVAIAAGASLGALFDHIDLDSHLNLDPDCARGAALDRGVVLPSETPGHGAELCDA